MEMFSILYVHLNYLSVQKYRSLRSLSLDEGITWNQLLHVLKFNSKGPPAIIYNLPLLLAFKLNEGDRKYSTQFYVMVNTKTSKTLNIENLNTEKDVAIEDFKKVGPSFRNRFVQQWYTKKLLQGSVPGTLSREFYDLMNSLTEPTLDQWDEYLY